MLTQGADTMLRFSNCAVTVSFTGCILYTDRTTVIYFTKIVGSLINIKHIQKAIINKCFNNSYTLTPLLVNQPTNTTSWL